MAKVINHLQCQACKDFLAGVKGAPLTRIACANCQQAKQDSKGRARTNHGPELKSALWALERGELIVMSEVVIEDSKRHSCPECGKVCGTRAEFATHREGHARDEDRAIEKNG
jgi:predicted RNA-binding Zn-ribbon protein involved in translation (DUF1610 family)